MADYYASFVEMGTPEAISDAMKERHWTGDIGAQAQAAILTLAMREVAEATARLENSTKQLNAAAGKFQWAAIAIGVAGVLAAIIVPLILA